MSVSSGNKAVAAGISDFMMVGDGANVARQTHPTIATLGHLLFAGGKEGLGIVLFYFFTLFMACHRGGRTA